MRKAFFPIVLLIFAGVIHAAFTLNSLDVVVRVASDGTVRVVEEIRIEMDERSAQRYDEVKRAQTLSIEDWAQLTGVTDLRYHIAKHADAVVIPGTKTLNWTTGNYHAIIRMEYDAAKMFEEKVVKPRTTRFSLLRDSISFERTEGGDVVLPKNTKLTFVFPKGSEIVSLFPDPQEPVSMRRDADGRIRGVESVAWGALTSSITLPKLEIVFEYEESLESEVVKFFTNIGSEVNYFLSSQAGAVSVVVVLLIIAGAVLLKGRKV